MVAKKRSDVNILQLPPPLPSSSVQTEAQLKEINHYVAVKKKIISLIMAINAFKRNPTEWTPLRESASGHRYRKVTLNSTFKENVLKLVESKRRHRVRRKTLDYNNKP